MEKEFIPYELALRMKALGFDEPCLASWSYTYELQQHIEFKLGYIIDGPRNYTNTPTYSQAFRWFRKKYELHSTITSISQESWQWHITKPGESLGKLYDEDFYTYEEAELACLEKLIEIIESKKE